jgi:hypothetical protein
MSIGRSEGRGVGGAQKRERPLYNGRALRFLRAWMATYERSVALLGWEGGLGSEKMGILM